MVAGESSVRAAWFDCVFSNTEFDPVVVKSIGTESSSSKGY